MCFLLMTFVPVQRLCVDINIYLYICIPYTSSGYRTYIHIYIIYIYTHIHTYIHRECCSVLVKLHPITVHKTVLGGVRGSWVECHLLFSFVSPIVSCYFIMILILGCLWPFIFVLNNILTPGILRSAISQLPGCFVFGPSLGISDSTWCHRITLCHI